MAHYVFKKILAGLGMVFGIGLVAFGILALAPGDPAEIMSQEGATEEQIEHLRSQMGLDRPVPVQFAIFAGNAVTGDLGTSLFTREPVSTMVMDRFPLTLTLAVGGIVWATALAIPIGTIAAMRRGTFIDFGIIGLSLIGVATPVFWRALVLILIFAVWLPMFPISGVAPPETGVLNNIKYLILPWFSLGLTSLGVIARVVRSSVLEQLNLDYAVTARSKGIRERTVLRRHVLRNSMIPVVTVVGLQFVGLLSGAVLTEIVFGLPGLGQMVVTAIARRDYPVVQGTLIVIGLTFVVVHIFIDLFYAVLDPRIRYS